MTDRGNLDSGHDEAALRDAEEKMLLRTDEDRPASGADEDQMPESSIPADPEA